MADNYTNDDFLKNALEKLEVPFNPDDWRAMEKQLDEQQGLGRSLLFAKFFEVLLVLAAVMTLTRFLPVEPSVEEEKTTPNKKEQLQQQPTQEMIRKFEEESKQPPAPPTIIQGSKGKKPIASADHSSLEHNNIIASNNVHYVVQQKITQESENFLVAEERANQANENSLVVANTSPKNGEASSIENDATTLPLLGASTSTKLVQSLAQAKLSLRIPSSELPSIAALPKPKSRKNRFRFGMKFGADNNIVLTPKSAENKRKDWKSQIGHSSGVSVAFGNGKWETETGLDYTFVSYPSSYTPQEVPSNVELKDMEYNLISVPVTFSYTFKEDAKSKAYVKLGGSLNMNLQSNYDYKSSTDERYLLDNSGLFSKGNFFDNTFINAQVGIGVEKKMTQNISLFIEPSYRYPLFGMRLGPNDNKIASLSLNLGAKVSL